MGNVYSIKKNIPSKVWELKLNSYEKFILICMDFHKDHEGLFDYSIRDLTILTGIGRTTVIKNIIQTII